MSGRRPGQRNLEFSVGWRIEGLPLTAGYLAVLRQAAREFPLISSVARASENLGSLSVESTLNDVSVADLLARFRARVHQELLACSDQKLESALLTRPSRDMRPSNDPKSGRGGRFLDDFWPHFQFELDHVSLSHARSILKASLIEESRQSAEEYVRELTVAFRQDAPALLDKSEPEQQAAKSRFVDQYTDADPGRPQEQAEALGQIALLMARAEDIRSRLIAEVDQARSNGANWSDIARAAGVTPQSAQQRWDQRVRERHNARRSRR